jgi:hypothetical protein
MRTKLWVAPLIALLLAALACNSGLPADTVLFKDDFSDASGEWSNAENMAFTEGRLVMRVDKDHTLIWTTIDEGGLTDVHIEVAAQNLAQVSDEIFGVVCGYKDNDNFYVLGIGSDGYYALEKYEKNEEQLLKSGMSKLIPVDDAGYQLGADCRDGSQTLYVNGKPIAASADTSFSAGDVGLFTSSTKKPSAAAAFDDFVVTQLK